jgi:hypothetical protein
MVQKDNKTNHLWHKENFRTAKSQEPEKLTIDKHQSTQFNSTRDIGMNMMHTDDVNTCILQLSTFIKDITGNTLRTFFVGNYC